MTYTVQRKSRFYVVAYDGIDTLTGRERRRWHPAGRSRTDAEAIAANLDAAHTTIDAPAGGDPLTVARYLTETVAPGSPPRPGPEHHSSAAPPSTTPSTPTSSPPTPPTAPARRSHGAANA